MIEEIRLNLPRIAALCRKTGVTRLNVFGSAARGEDFRPGESDIDVEVTFDRSLGLDPFLTYFELKWGLEEIFGRDVDVLVAGANRNTYFNRQLDADRQEVFHA
jgi:predicted nucleotidyltransferase